MSSYLYNALLKIYVIVYTASSLHRIHDRASLSKTVVDGLDLFEFGTQILSSLFTLQVKNNLNDF